MSYLGESIEPELVKLVENEIITRANENKNDENNQLKAYQFYVSYSDRQFRVPGGIYDGRTVYLAYSFEAALLKLYNTMDKINNFETSRLASYITSALDDFEDAYGDQKSWFNFFNNNPDALMELVDHIIDVEMQETDDWFLEEVPLVQ